MGFRTSAGGRESSCGPAVAGRSHGEPQTDFAMVSDDHGEDPARAATTPSTRPCADSIALTGYDNGGRGAFRKNSSCAAIARGHAVAWYATVWRGRADEEASSSMITTIQAGHYTIRGVSVGGVYTALMVPELGAMLDVGMAPRSFAGTARLFLSHGHVDHLGGLLSFLGLRGLAGQTQLVEVFLPAAIVSDVENLLRAAMPLQRFPLEIVAVPMEPGQVVSLRGDLQVRAFRTFHPVPSLGFQFLRRVKKLRPEFAHLPGPEIGRRRLAGEDLFEEVEHLELAYATDTLVQVLDAEPSILQSKVLILECTFLDERKSLRDARAGCHIHLDELLERADAFANEQLVLMHFSQIYKPREVVEILRARCPEHLYRRIVPFVPRESHWPG
jgi:ribonuclease Z